MFLITSVVENRDKGLKPLISKNRLAAENFGSIIVKQLSTNIMESLVNEQNVKYMYILAKGEIANFEHLLMSPQCFPN